MTTIHAIALSLFPGISAASALRLIEEFGSAERVLERPAASLTEIIGANAAKLQGVDVHELIRLAQSELALIKRQGAAAVGLDDEHYPSLLREMHDPPTVLYHMGDISNIGLNAISVVGSRDCTSYGARACREIIGRIAELYPQAVIVSGLAEGIDAMAHSEALEAGLRTVAVVASRLDKISPNRQLAERILDHGGAIVTEHSSQSKSHFGAHVVRNRIIAGLSAGTLIVESGHKGGSMTTADLAVGYARTLMAVPGSIFSPMSFGPNLLHRQKMAESCSSGDDVAILMDWADGYTTTRERPSVDGLPERLRQVLSHIDHEPTPETTIAMKMRCAVHELSVELFELESLKLIKPSTGGFYYKL